MAFILLASALMLATVALVRPAVAAGPPLVLTGFDGTGVVLAFAGFVAVALSLGPVFGFALMLAFLLREFGQVLASRIAGHRDARFRLIPFWNGATISDQAPGRDLDAFFITLMGPGISLAPMVLAFALAEALRPVAPLASNLFWQFALATGALNFVCLLPLWPLDGGRCARILVRGWNPRFSTPAAGLMSAALIGLAVLLHSVLLALLALVGAGVLIRSGARGGDRPPPLTRPHLRLALVAYATTLAAFFLGGWWVLRLIPLA